MTKPDDNSSPVGSGILAKANRLLRSSSTRSDGNILPLSNWPNTSPPSHQSGQGIISGIANDSGSHSATDASYRDTPTSGSGGPPPNEKNEPANPIGIDGPGQNGRAGAGEGDDQGSVVGGGQTAKVKRNILVRFFLTTRAILFHSYVNVLLVFVPVGIAVQAVPGVPVGAVFAINSVAIIPLAGLLSHATESVASKLGDTVGALLNVTFGNAVELIIFIALAKDEIRIVQASLLGSILANLLLILGMCFFLGGLRYREQIYNSTVTQMSACLLSLSVMSLVLPTAFHASFSDTALADSESLKISRGCSVVLLLVYLVYLLFQLKSHAYMYESTPQHIVDAESTPGPAAGWLDTSSSEDSSSSDSDSDSSGSSQHTVRQRMKKVLRGGRGRKSSSSSSDSTGTANTNGKLGEADGAGSSRADGEAVVDGSDADEENDEKQARSRRRRRSKGYLRYKQYQRYKQSRKEKKQRRKARENAGEEDEEAAGTTAAPAVAGDGEPSSVAAAGQSGEIRRVDFAVTDEKRKPSFPPAPLKGVSIKNLAPSVFIQGSDTPAAVPTGPVPRVRYGIRRTNSLPDRLNSPHNNAIRAPGAMLPAQIPLISLTSGAAAEAAQDDEDNFDKLSTVSAVILLLVSTGLVALCAEFVVDSINEVVEQGGVKEAFIGLIILPIVGNAAEHVTAITVAMKNKMDLAIGVAVGSSIQIALFVTPLVVMIGWAMGKEMTLYFTLFETVCLFVSAFIVNFLVLDGRSNYLEGALLMCSYVIIGVIAFYYPNVSETNELGGGG